MVSDIVTKLCVQFTQDSGLIKFQCICEGKCFKLGICTSTSKCIIF